MSKKLFVAPFLSGGGNIDLNPSGGLIGQSVQPDTLVVELPDGTNVIADEFGEILDEITESVDVIDAEVTDMVE